MSSTTLTRSATGDRQRLLGLTCLAGALIGVTQGVAMALWPPEVGPEWYSYPLSPGGYATAQVTFFLQHLPLVLGLLAVAQLPAVNRTRTGRIGAWAAVAGMVLLAIQELVAITAKDVLVESSRADLVSSLYGLPTVLIGLGLTVAGVTALRAGPHHQGVTWLPGVVLATGVYVFVALVPSLMGPFTIARLGIAGWMVLFAALGLGVARSALPAPDQTPVVVRG